MYSPKLKICGLNNENNIKELVLIQPDFIGFVFYKNSLRNAEETLNPDYVCSLPSNIKKVGVFVNEIPEKILRFVNLYKLDFVQLHGNETPAFCKQLKKSVGVIKAFGIDEKFDFKILKMYNEVCDYYLFDTKSNQHGGSGNMFNHQLLNQYKENKEFFLSGGLSEINMDEALDKKNSNLFALDFNSRIELLPGIKDVQKVKSIIQKIRNYEL